LNTKVPTVFDVDRNRRTGRTTRMIVRLLNAFFTSPAEEQFVVLCHTGQWASQLKAIVAKMLVPLGVPFNTKVHNAAQHEITVDNRTIYFVSKPYEERFFQGRKRDSNSIFYDNSYYIE